MASTPWTETVNPSELPFQQTPDTQSRAYPDLSQLGIMTCLALVEIFLSAPFILYKEISLRVPRSSRWSRNLFLCARCRSITLDRLGHGFKLHRRYRHLQRNSETCSLCRLVLKTLGPASSDASVKFKVKQEWMSRGRNLDIIELTAGTVEGRLRVSAEPDVPGAALTINSPLRKEGGSPQNLELARKWIDCCYNSHERCLARVGKQKRQLPTRVIDVGAKDENSVKILESHGREDHWIALSHCWGRKGFLTATIENIERLKTGILVSELPQSFQDAIKIARVLGVRYIWIDSLCIIQNSPEDWEREAAMMPMIYANSYITLAAGVTNNAYGGILLQRLNYIESVPFQMSEGTVYFERSIQADGHRIDSAVAEGESTLASRAWCLQEAILSIRVLSFTSSRMFWICAAEEKTEQNYRQKESLHRRIDLLAKLSSITSSLSHLKSEVRTDEGSGTNWQHEYPGFSNTWYTVVTDYCKRELTMPTDKLPALAGLAQWIGDRFSDVYLAGLWKHALPHALLWHIAIPGGISWEMKRVRESLPAEYRAPSWSWASMNGPIDFDNCRIGRNAVSRVIAADTVPSGTNRYGPVKGGSITLNAPLKKGIVGMSQTCASHHERDSLTPGTLPALESLGPEGGGFIGDLCACIFDHRDLPRGTEVLCLQITVTHGLLLEEISSGELAAEKVYRRIGIFVLDDDEDYPTPDWFKWSERRTVIIL